MTGIRLEQGQHRATIILDRPAQHNALTQQDLRNFMAALNQVRAANDIRVLTITGAGEKTFCAGASLQQLTSGDFETDEFERLTNAIETLPIPTIAALNGSAYGGGTEIALACDFRVGIEGTRMFVPVAKLGLCYPLSGIKRYVAKLGVGPTKRLLMAHDTWDAAAMYHLGFLDYLVAKEDFEPFVAELSGRIAGLAPLAVQGMKSIITALAAGDFDEASAQATLQRCINSQDLQEGLTAQAQKRPPQFKNG